MNWLDEVDRLGDIESSPVSCNICFVNAVMHLVRKKKRKTRYRHTYTNLHQLAVLKIQHSPSIAFMPNILLFYWYNNDPLFVSALKRSFSVDALKG